jgi:hypothetical protein
MSQPVAYRARTTYTHRYNDIRKIVPLSFHKYHVDHGTQVTSGSDKLNNPSRSALKLRTKIEAIAVVARRPHNHPR